MAAQFGFVLIGIATGEASHLAVLDIDRQHNGAEWWLANRPACRRRSPIGPALVVCISGSGIRSACGAARRVLRPAST
jgi:hypothetical protein